MRLLLVDDDPGLRELLRTTFEIFDLELDEADSAAMAARRISACKPDVIVLDVLMPGIDGLEYTRALRSDPQTRDIPIVLLTGSDLTELERLARRRAGQEAVQPARAAVGRRAPRRWNERRAASVAAQRGLGGAAAPVRERPPPPPRDRAPAARAAATPRTTTPSPRSPARSSRRTRARAPIRSACSSTRWSSPACARPSCSTIRASSTASCCTTSARSGFPTACSRSPRRCRSPSGA